MKKLKLIISILLVCATLSGCTTSGFYLADTHSHPEGPYLYFYSYAGLKNFVLTFPSNGERIGKGYGCSWDSGSESDRQELVDRFNSILIPRYIGEESWKLYGLYFSGGGCGELYLQYTVGSIEYVFQYYLGERPTVVTKGKPVEKNISVGEYTADLYKGREAFFGAFEVGETLVVMTICTTDIKEIKTEYFEFGPIIE